MNPRLLRVTSRIGMVIAYATVAVAGLVAMAAVFINASCGPMLVGIDVASTQPVRVDLVVPPEPIAVTVLHGEIDSPLARYRWALAAGGIIAVAVAWRMPWPFRRGRSPP